MQANPFPFDRSPNEPQPEASRTSIDRAGLEAAYEKLLGVPLRARLVSQALVGAGQLAAHLLEPCVALVLERAEAGPAERLLVECTPATAALFVDRALGGDGALELVQGLDGLDDMSIGVLAYVAARLLADAKSGLTLRTIVSDRSSVLAAVGGERDAWVSAIALQVGTRSVTLRTLSLRPSLAGLTDASQWLPPPALAGVSLELSAQAGRGVLPVSEASTLSTGDVVVLDESSLLAGAEGFEGSVWLATSLGQPLFSATMRGARLEIAHTCVREDRPMPASTRVCEAGAGTTDLADDTPIELCAEIARFTLTLEALSALAPGSVLVTSERIGDSITLRAGGRAIAEGELVDVEGEIGVRVTRVLP